MDQTQSSSSEEMRLHSATLKEAFHRARVPYSNRASGARLLTDKGEFFGSAVEYCNYTNSICAPTVSVLCAIAAGARKFKQLEVYSSSSCLPCGEPCGRCLEFLKEFCNNDLPIRVVVTDESDDTSTEDRVNKKTILMTATLEELLPNKWGISRKVEDFRQKSRPDSALASLVANVSSMEVTVVNPTAIAHLKFDIVVNLCREAIKVCAHAYIPQSNFPVGAAVLDDNNTIISGANIEHSIIGLGICAERTALARAISMGSQKFQAIAVVLPKSNDYARPCGACRQSLIEFGSYCVLQIKLINGKAEIYATTTTDLLPQAFSPESL